MKQMPDQFPLFIKATDKTIKKKLSEYGLKLWPYGIWWVKDNGGVFSFYKIFMVPGGWKLHYCFKKILPTVKKK